MARVFLFAMQQKQRAREFCAFCAGNRKKILKNT
jgi:hypothetical protein